MDYKAYWEKIYQQCETLNDTYSAYWHDHSHMGTWQFWVLTATLVLPLLLLVLVADRKRIFEIFFFGYTIHVLWSYIDISLERYGYFVHTYFLMPALPYGLNMSASALPVSYLLLYQFCTSRGRSFYLYSLFLSAGFAFLVAPIEASIGLLELHKGMNYVYLFLIDVGITYTAYAFTMLLRRGRASAMRR